MDGRLKVHVKYRLCNIKFFQLIISFFKFFSHDLGVSTGINELPSLYGLNKVASKIPVCTTFFKEAVKL